MYSLRIKCLFSTKRYSQKKQSICSQCAKELTLNLSCIVIKKETDDDDQADNDNIDLRIAAAGQAGSDDLEDEVVIGSCCRQQWKQVVELTHGAGPAVQQEDRNYLRTVKVVVFALI